MKNLILMLVSCMFLTGCNGVLPKINFDTPNTVPQEINKSTAKEECKGKSVMNEAGAIISCTKGYSNYAKNYVKEERQMTITERIKSFINNLTGWGFWLLLVGVVLLNNLTGGLVGIFFKESWGITSRSFKSVIRAVQKARKEGKDLNASLDKELDEDMRKYIAKIKERENI